MSTGPVTAIASDVYLSALHMGAKMGAYFTLNRYSASPHALTDALDVAQISLDDNPVRSLTLHIKQIAERNFPPTVKHG